MSLASAGRPAALAAGRSDGSQDAARRAALQDAVKRHQAAFRRAVVAGAESRPGIDLQRHAASPPARAVMGAVEEEASGTDRGQPLERLAHPVLLRHGGDDARRESIDLPRRFGLFRAAEIENQLPQRTRLIRLVDGDGERVEADILLQCGRQIIGAIMRKGRDGEGKARFGHDTRFRGFWRRKEVAPIKPQVSGTMRISTRRFWARPSAVSLEAMGSFWPMPRTWKRCGLLP